MTRDAEEFSAMLKVFVDTAAWIALVNTSDGLHASAQTVMTNLRGQNARLMTTEFVLLEVANALSAPAFRVRAAALIDGLRTGSNVSIVQADTTLLNDGWKLYGDRPDKEWSLTDCTSFIVMQREGITQAFTSDHHFEQAGFVKLL